MKHKTLEEKKKYLEDLGLPVLEFSNEKIIVWYNRAIGMKITREQIQQSGNLVDRYRWGNKHISDDQIQMSDNKIG